MLEVRNLTKVYKTKGGADTHALDGVSVRFPETGMVFLLGKSGSGKSTLLNVCGGLDAPTSGEIIVKGRSSKDFTQSDFDSYRNTFVGFIFQEYNILNEFSVEDNVALALELQGKSKDKQAIAQLLEDVDLTGFAKRKPNTLSGGQKQRIAIARALVKAPEIIMADEPTGALDSATGKQVFDTLKKLSKDKLVIVVSHDRDFAELYGDRVIELKDGKIISDVSKTQEEQKVLSANVTAVGDTLCVKDGAKLSDKDFDEIRAFLKKSGGDVIIATGEKDVKTFKDVSRITDEGGKEVFRDTDENKLEKKDYKPEDSKFIRSKLPMRHAMKIGASGLKTKPFRLIFTVLLSAIAFIMFGLFSTMMLYEKDATLYQSIDDAQPSVLRITKKYRYTEYNEWDGETHSYEQETYTPLTQAELDEMASKFGGEAFGVVYFQNSWSGFDTVNIDFDSSEEAGDYYQPKLAFAASLPAGHAMRNRITSGNYPANDDEICISSYTASVLVKYKLGGVSDASALIGKTFELRLNNLGTKKFTISGIFNSDEQALASEYSALQETQTALSDDEQAKLLTKLTTALKDGLHMVAFVTDNVRSTILANANNSSNERGKFESLSEHKYQLNFSSEASYGGYYFKLSELSADGEYAFFGDKSSLEDGEVLVSYNVLSNILNDDSNKGDNELYNQASNEFTTARDLTWDDGDNGENDIHGDFPLFFNGNIPPQGTHEYLGYELFLDIINKAEYATLKQQYERNLILYKNITVTVQGIDFTENLLTFLDRCRNGTLPYQDEENETSVELTLTNADRKTIINAISPELNQLDLSFTGKAMSVEGQQTAVSKGAKQLTIVGILFPDNEYGHSYIALNETTYAHFKTISDDENPNWSSSKNWTETKYEKPSNAIYNALYIPYNSSLKSELSTFTFEWAADDSRYSVAHAVGDALEMVNEMIENLSTVFMWIGIVMAVFAALLLSNFISVSISHKKRDIGILRAVGARSFDVFKIFFSESFLIAFISIVVSMVGCFVACSFINAEVGAALSGVSLFVFGPVSMLILVGVAVVTAVIATFLPVYNAAKKKPVDSIRAIV